MGYSDSLFDPRFMQYGSFRQTRLAIEAAEDNIDAMRDGATRGFAQQQQQIHDLSVTVMALVEILVEDGKLTIEDLQARVKATLIGERAEKREHSDPAQAGWDELKK
jgi:hypothetical protein